MCIYCIGNAERVTVIRFARLFRIREEQLANI